jgi:hypothetical protein
LHDARYFRSRAELCLTMAQQMSDPRAAQNLRTMAALYIERAIVLENRQTPSRSASSADD